MDRSEDPCHEIHGTSPVVCNQVQRWRRLLGTADRVERAAETGVVDVVTRHRCVRAVGSPSGHTTVYELGVRSEAVIGADTEPFDHTRSISLEQNVGPGDELENDVDGLRLLEIESDRSLPPTKGTIERVRHGRATGSVDTDHLGTQPREDHPGERHGP